MKATTWSYEGPSPPTPTSLPNKRQPSGLWTPRNFLWHYRHLKRGNVLLYCDRSAIETHRPCFCYIASMNLWSYSPNWLQSFRGCKYAGVRSLFSPQLTDWVVSNLEQRDRLSLLLYLLRERDLSVEKIATFVTMGAYSKRSATTGAGSAQEGFDVSVMDRVATIPPEK